MVAAVSIPEAPLGGSLSPGMSSSPSGSARVWAVQTPSPGRLAARPMACRRGTTTPAASCTAT
eukprot:8582456-Lingulodinium_polyedra.AAC.1